MSTVLLVIHLILALAIIGLVLLQRSEGGGLGIGGGNGGLGSFASVQSTAGALTRITGICAALFFCTSLILGIMAGNTAGKTTNVLDLVDQQPAAIEKAVDAKPADEATKPETPKAPQVPVGD
ncbi:MAG: preprotein translocase subunit SecG [Alphaproteobacteria bacterium]|nr:preprotein translocase subunit SecG [Alphaproteobacteria bacterium]